ncbi:hypothetical protein BDZ91DRAFT_768275 [Kalaharituber pfeilii]|nr:hypothetical protein BDZ91DRAFT_768275 [Kalaharituber pfeilii]
MAEAQDEQPETFGAIDLVGTMLVLFGMMTLCLLYNDNKHQVHRRKRTRSRGTRSRVPNASMNTNGRLKPQELQNAIKTRNTKPVLLRVKLRQDISKMPESYQGTRNEDRVQEFSSTRGSQSQMNESRPRICSIRKKKLAAIMKRQLCRTQRIKEAFRALSELAGLLRELEEAVRTGSCDIHVPAYFLDRLIGESRYDIAELQISHGGQVTASSGEGQIGTDLYTAQFMWALGSEKNVTLLNAVAASDH